LNLVKHLDIFMKKINGELLKKGLGMADVMKEIHRSTFYFLSLSIALLPSIRSIVRLSQL
jgi:hypothetical protein